jgi:hypothetical protein
LRPYPDRKRSRKESNYDEEDNTAHRGRGTVRPRHPGRDDTRPCFDAVCGTDRYSAVLAAAGHDVVGVRQWAPTATDATYENTPAAIGWHFRL